MPKRIADLPLRRVGGNRIAAMLCLLVFTACSSGPALSGRPAAVDSLAETAKREFVLASLLNAKGEYRGAIEGYRRVLKREPSNAALHYALSKSFAALGVLDSARVYGEKSVQLDPAGKHYLRYLAALSHTQNDYNRAAELYRRLADLEPGSVEPLSYLAIEYLAADQPEKSLAVWQEILLVDPASQSTQAQVLLLQLKLSHYTDAIGTLNRLIAEGDGKEKLRLTLAELYLQTRQYDLAFRTIRELIGENPGSAPAWLALFEVSVQSAEFETFQGDLKRFYDTPQISLKEQIEIAQLFLGRSSKDSSYAGPAHAMIAEIKRRNPLKSEVYSLSGTALMQQRRGAAALGEFNRALALAPRRVENWENLVTAHLELKEYPQASRVLYRAAKRIPTLSLRLQVLKGELLMQSGALRKAASLLERLMQQKNAREEPWLTLQAGSTLALCYDRLGLYDKCIRVYLRMLELEPDNTLMMNNLAYILARENKELPMAKELAMKAVAAEPANASYLDTLGWVLFRMGEYEDALKLLEKASARDPREAEIFDHLGAVYEKLGNHAKALEMKEKSRRLKRR